MFAAWPPSNYDHATPGLALLLYTDRRKGVTSLAPAWDLSWQTVVAGASVADRNRQACPSRPFPLVRAFTNVRALTPAGVARLVRDRRGQCPGDGPKKGDYVALKVAIPRVRLVASRVLRPNPREVGNAEYSNTSLGTKPTQRLASAAVPRCAASVDEPLDDNPHGGAEGRRSDRRSGPVPLGKLPRPSKPESRKPKPRPVCGCGNVAAPLKAEPVADGIS